MATRGPTVEPDMGVGGIISTGVSVVTDDLRIPGLQLLAVLLSAIPIVGALLSIVISGVATQFADETLGNPAPENSLGIRFLYAILVILILVPILGIGFLLFILPGVFLALKFSLAIPAVWIGDKGPLEALSDSWSRTKGHLVTIFGVGFVFFMIAMVTLVPAFIVFVPFGSAEAIQQFNQQPLILASPPLFGVQTLYAITVGAVGIAAQAIMYRSFGGRQSEDATDEFGTETEF